MGKQNIVIFLLVITILSFYDCGKHSPSKSLSPSILWDNEQTLIHTADGTKNLWSGFDIKGNFFVANKTIAKLVVWRTEEKKKKITLAYLLIDKPAEVFVNSQPAFKLKPSYNLRTFSIDIPLLKGFNFIEFRTTAKSIFKLKTLQIGNPAVAHPYHLAPGESLSHFHPPGSGHILLESKGSVRIRIVEFKEGQQKNREKEMKPGFLSSTITYSFTFEFPGFLEVSALSGPLTVSNYTFAEAQQDVRTDADTQEPVPAVLTKKTEKPNAHIFLIDGCHADHLGVYGYHRDTSPNIQRLAADSVVFDNAYANATFTRSSVASIFTGFHPHRHKLRVITNRLPKGLFLLPEFMQKKEYKTAILTEAGNISKFFGFAQGVDVYKKVFRRWDDPRYLEKNMFKFFSRWIKNKGPLFTYVHFRAPHFPIIPPFPFLDMYKEATEKKEKPGKNRLILNLKQLDRDGYTFSPAEVNDIIADYDSTIRFVDDEVGKLLDLLKEKGRYESSLIIFTSDHGEALYEHSYWGHGQNVYPETSRVPLIVKFPAYMKLNGHVERVTQLVDIFPTLAALLAEKNDEKRYFDGENLLNAIQVKNEDDTFGFSTSFGLPPSIGIRWGSWYYIIHLFDGKEELFNLKKNPRENMAGTVENKDLLTFFRAKFLDWYIDFDNIERTSQSVDLKKLPKGEYENLKSLGYID